MARIAVGGFMHETNTFAPIKADWAAFDSGGDRPPILRGPQVLTGFGDMNVSIAGAFDVLGHHELVPLAWAGATPSGYVTEDAYERITALIVDALAAAMPVDAVFLNLHGAMTAEHVEDGEGELLRRVRAVVGPDLPVVASLDLHSNTTPDMARLATAMVGYRTYPHVDMRATGRRAGRLLDRIMREHRLPATAYRQVPFLIPLTWQCTMVEPCASIYRLIGGIEAEDDGLCITFTPGFPAADMRECGAAVLVHARCQAEADAVCAQVWQAVVDAEAAFAGRLYAPEAAIRAAVARAAQAARPVILADTQDNPGAGGTGDTVGLLKAMVALQPEGAVIGIVHDALAAAAATQAGVGGTISVPIGARAGWAGETPLEATATVERLADGNFTCTGPMWGGAKMALGPMALLRIGKVGVVVSSKKVQAGDQAMFRHVGVEPSAQKIVALKSSVHFRADFQPIAEEILVVESPGPMVVDPAKLPFTKLRPDLRRNPRSRGDGR